ncbi:MAG TPA: DDE-type integrase/transposase/recombinase [Anaerolineae bacterium]|nr:DDE-type integrase/transposase/recombinase [Anaerolineae bacterium]
MEVFRTAAALMVRSMVLSAQAAGQQRLLWLQQSAAVGGEVGEVARLRDENRQLKWENRLLKARDADAPCRKRYSPLQRLQILWHMECYRIPRSRVKEHFLIAKSTLYRWLHAAQEGNLGERKSKSESPRKTPAELAQMIWDIFEANPYVGWDRIASILWLLGVFVGASTVRNILLQPKPKNAPAAAKAQQAPAAPRQIVARYPNHVWSVDRTRVMRWGIWPTWVLVAIDHFSRKVVACRPLEGPNAGWVVGAMEEAFLQYGAPRHLISDQEGVFISDAFRELLIPWNVKHRFGAVGKHGSIAVTERVILTLKYEWLKRVPVIRGLDHLDQLLRDFALYYNEYRGHTTLGGAVPSLIHRGEQWTKPEKSAKALPPNVERRVFPDTQITAYRLAA